MSSEDTLFELMSKMYGEMQEGFKEVNKRINGVESEVNSVKKVALNIEHGNKLNALFDGCKQNAEKLDRIEEKVSKHEEIILRRIT